MSDEDDTGDDTRPEIAVYASFAATVAGAVLFAVGYAMDWGNQFLGVALALAFGGLAVGLTVWSRHLLGSGGYVEEHEGFASPPAETDALAGRLTEVAHPNRRGLLAMLTAAVAAIGAALVFPVRSLLQPHGDNPAAQLARTAWGTGSLRLVDAEQRPVRLRDVAAETVLRVFPEGHTAAGDVPTFLVRLDPQKFKAAPPAGDIRGVVAYSLLCTHAGCPVSLYEQTTGKMLCPCHQSVFDLLAGGRPVAGPAARSLPGLPIAVGRDGILYNTGDFTSPPGPGYWSRP